MKLSITTLAMSFLVLSTPSLANQEHCKQQAIKAVEGVQYVSTLDAGVSASDKEMLKQKHSALTKLIDEKRYCEALAGATSK